MCPIFSVLFYIPGAGVPSVWCNKHFVQFQRDTQDWCLNRFAPEKMGLFNSPFHFPLQCSLAPATLSTVFHPRISHALALHALPLPPPLAQYTLLRPELRNNWACKSGVSLSETREIWSPSVSRCLPVLFFYQCMILCMVANLTYERLVLASPIESNELFATRENSLLPTIMRSWKT